MGPVALPIIAAKIKEAESPVPYTSSFTFSTHTFQALAYLTRVEPARFDAVGDVYIWLLCGLDLRAWSET